MRHDNSQRLPLDQAQESSTRGQDNNTRGFDLQPLQQEVRICCIVQRAHVPVPSVTGGCFFIFNLLVCLLSSAYVLCICSTIFFGRWRIAQLVPGPAIVNQSLPANQEADSAVQTCQMQWRPAPWPRHHLFATTAGRFLRTQRTLPDILRSTTRGEFFL